MMTFHPDAIVVWEGPSRWGGRCAACDRYIARGGQTAKVWDPTMTGTNRGGQGPGIYVHSRCAAGVPRKEERLF